MVLLSILLLAVPSPPAPAATIYELRWERALTLEELAPAREAISDRLNGLGRAEIRVSPKKVVVRYAPDLLRAVGLGAGPPDGLTIARRLSSRGQLEFAPIVPVTHDFEALPPGIQSEDLSYAGDGKPSFVVQSADAAALCQWLSQREPPGDARWILEERVDDYGARSFRAWAVSESVLSRADIAQANAVRDADYGTYQVSISFTEDATPVFAALTERLRGELLGILYDGRLLSAPKVLERISGGEARVTLGAFAVDDHKEEAEAMAAAIRARPLPARLVFPSGLPKLPEAPEGCDHLSTAKSSGP